MERVAIELTIDSREDLSARTIASYLKRFTEFHDKVIILERMSDILLNRKHDIYSSFLINKPKIEYVNFDKDEDIEHFFKVFSRISSPDVRVLADSYSLFDYRRDTVTIKRLSYNSPLVAIITIGLAFANFILDENRKRELFELDYKIKTKQLEIEEQRLEVEKQRLEVEKFKLIQEAMDILIKTGTIKKILEDPNISQAHKYCLSTYLFNTAKGYIYLNNSVGGKVDICV